MSLREDLLESLRTQRAAEAEAADRDRTRDLLRSTGACLAWAAVGILAIMWSAHTTNSTLGKIAFYGGIAVGNGGILFTALAAYRRGERRGDW